MKIARVTGFPFHPPADKREDTIHVFSAHFTRGIAALYRSGMRNRRAAASHRCAGWIKR